MARHTQFIQLSKEERRSLKTLFRSAKGSNRQHTRARILHLLDREVPLPEIAQTLSCGIATVYNVNRRYLAEGLEATLSDKARAGRPPRLDGRARAKITAMACSAAPMGHARWTLRLVADRAVQLGFCQALSHNAVKEILKKTDSSRT